MCTRQTRKGHNCIDVYTIGQCRSAHCCV
uniref:Uncharacterized protein n=1 Tax=Anguilla anguilla TaxID=7936 RepID=A0A0E9TAK2_ANGAN